jgi:hypothetical protein
MDYFRLLAAEVEQIDALMAVNSNIDVSVANFTKRAAVPTEHYHHMRRMRSTACTGHSSQKFAEHTHDIS